MAFSYDEDESHISSSDYVSAIRFALQDTVAAEVEFSDGEIDAQFAGTDDTQDQTVRNLRAAVKLARILQRRYAKQASFSSQGTSVQLLERAKFWGSMVSDLEGELQVAEMEAGNVDRGGILIAGRETSFNDQLGVDLGALGGGSLGGYIV
jgi:hypothetical protein